MPPPPPPPPATEVVSAMMTTPPPKHKTHGYASGYGRAADRTTMAANHSSPATSASSVASPSQLMKTRSMNEAMLSPRVRGRLDPYPRYSPRKRLSGDFSDGTYSAESGVDSPKSEKGGWRIHAAVNGPFLTGPLAKDFAMRLEELRSPRSQTAKKENEPDFDNNGLLFPIVPDFVAPAISPEVFQASIQPTQTQPQPQPEPDMTAPAAPAPEMVYAADATWEPTQQQDYYYSEQQQQEQYAAEQQAYYYNNGYDHLQFDQQYDQQQQQYGYSAEDYNYQPSYEQHQASADQAPVEYNAVAPPTEEAFPPLLPPSTTDVSLNQVAEEEETVAAPPSPSRPPVQRPRAPSYAEVVSGAAHVSTTSPPTVAEPLAKTETKKASPAKSTFAAFDQLSDSIAESMSHILTKSDNNKTHAEVEFSCLIHRIQTQLKLMGRVSNSLHLKQMKTLHKLQQSEIEKLSAEASSMQLLTRVQKYEQEQQELKKQLAEALEAKDVRLKDAVDQLTRKIDSLKSSNDASTSKLVAEIDAIRSCSSSDDLEKRVQEIGDVLDYLIENQQTAEGKMSPPQMTRRPSKFDARRQSVGSWKAIALYAIVVWAASLCGVWVGVKFAGTMHQAPVVAHPEVVQQVAPVVMAPVEVAPAVVEVVTPLVVEVAAPAMPVEQIVPVIVEEVAEPVVAPVIVESEPEEPAVVVDEVREIEVDAVSGDVAEPVVVARKEVAMESVADVVEEVETVPPVAVMDEVTVAEPTSSVDAPVAVTVQELPHIVAPSCFTSPSDHSTLASFFCEMISEAVTVYSAPVQETIEPTVEVSEPVVEIFEPVVEIFEPVVESFESVVEISEPAVAAAESVVEVVESAAVVEVPEPVTVASEDLVSVIEQATEEVLEIEAVEPIAAAAVEEVAVVVASASTASQSVPMDECSPLVHALYVWCPSLFEMSADETDFATSPLGDLARALTSLSTQILPEDTSSKFEDVTEEPALPTFEVIEEVQEPVQEVAEVAAAVEEVVPVTEVVEAAAEAPVEVAAVEEVDAPNNRWVKEQLLINIDAMSGTVEVAAVVEPAEESVEATVPVWSLAEVTVPFATLEPPSYSNSSADVEMVAVETASTVEAVEAVEETVVADGVEVVAEGVSSPVAVEEVKEVVAETQPAASCAITSCPLFETSVATTTFTNATDAVAAAASDEEVSSRIPIGSSPVLDLKSLLLTAL